MNEIEAEIRVAILRKLRSGRHVIPGCLNTKTNKQSDEAVIRRMIEDGTLVNEPNGKFSIRAAGQTKAA
jgi:hypothetical protein